MASLPKKRHYDVPDLDVFNASDIEVYPECGHPIERYENGLIKSPFCKTLVLANVSCGHTGFKACYQKLYVCQTRCDALMNCRRHQCRQQCGLMHSHDSCQKTAPVLLGCGHEVLMECKGDPNSVKCQVEVQALFTCGHFRFKKCFEALYPQNCASQCGAQLPCGNHWCDKPCSTTHIHDNVCNLPASKELPCGHSQIVNCNEDARLEECKEPVETQLPTCEHPIRVLCHQKGNLSMICPVVPCGKFHLSSQTTCPNSCGEICKETSLKEIAKSLKVTIFQRRIASQRSFLQVHDPLLQHQRTAETHLLKMLQKRGKPFLASNLESIDVVYNLVLEEAFLQKQFEFSVTNVSQEIVFGFHGTAAANVDSILNANLQTRYMKRSLFGKGIYLSEFPDISLGYPDTLMLFMVLPGREFVKVDQDPKGDIPIGYDSIKVTPDGEGFGAMLILGDSDQILPYAVYNFKKP